VLNRVYPCVILAIDPGKDGGAAIFAPRFRDRLYSTQVRRREWRLREEIVIDAFDCAHSYACPLVVVREHWPGNITVRGRKANPTMFAGLGAAWGLWQAELMRVADVDGNTRPKVVKVHPRTWQAQVIGGRMKKAEEAAEDRAMHCRRYYDETRTWGPDETAAVCMGEWAQRAESVGSVLPKSAWTKSTIPDEQLLERP